MTIFKVLEVITKYEDRLTEEGVMILPRERHLLSMFQKMRQLAAEERTEKLMRWLGFVQGVLWVRGYYSIDELKAHNAPEVQA